MTGEIFSFDAQVGGGYRMSLFYPSSEPVFRGKTSERQDSFTSRFVNLILLEKSSRQSPSSLPIQLSPER
jgi:hypothetical protein